MGIARGAVYFTGSKSQAFAYKDNLSYAKSLTYPEQGANVWLKSDMVAYKDKRERSPGKDGIAVAKLHY